MPNKTLAIRSFLGDYRVDFTTLDADNSNAVFRDAKIAIVDREVYRLYSRQSIFRKLKAVIEQDADEAQKTAETAIGLCNDLVRAGFKRGDRLLAIGGGIIQDLSTFVSSILYRGITWTYVPTTLLAQADSCVGGKSSLNTEVAKNLLGNFYPPKRILVIPEFLETLPENHIRSGIGEIIKVHFLSGVDMVSVIEHDMQSLPDDRKALAETTARALELKVAIIQEDEFDTGPRLKMNYGHTFGHALEAATRYRIPHGLAVTFGADMANYMSWKTGRISEKDYRILKNTIDRNIRPGDWHKPDQNVFFAALRKDKKNRDGQYCFILPVSVGEVSLSMLPMSDNTDAILRKFIAAIRA